MQHKALCLLVGFAVVVNDACAHGMSMVCPGPKLSEVVLQQTSCEERTGLTAIRYSDVGASSAYATAFDRRSVVVLFGHDVHAVKSEAGLPARSSEHSLYCVKLVEPPFADQIESRKAAKRPIRHRTWTVLTERVQYEAQGGAAGFVIDCATAMKSSKGGSVAIAECFALEERQRFFRTLDLVR
jgi:hypothetical protein